MASQKPTLSQSTGGLFDKTKDLALAANRKIADTLAPLRKGSDTLPPVAATAPARTDPHPPIEDIDQGATFEALKKRGADLKAKGIDPKTDPEYRELARKQAKGISQNLESAAQLGAPLGVIGKGVAGAVKAVGERLGAKAGREALQGVAPKLPSEAPKVDKVAPSEPPASAAVPGAPEEGPLTKPPAVEKPRELEGQLFQLQQRKVKRNMDAIAASKRLAPIVAENPGIAEKLYHYRESTMDRPVAGAPEKVELTPKEQAIYDKHLKPIVERVDSGFRELEGYVGEPIERTGHVPREVEGKTRSWGESLRLWKQGIEARIGGAASRSLRKTVDAQKSRRFYIATNPETRESRIVHVGTDGTVLTFDGTPKAQDFGSFPKGQKVAPGSKIRVDGQTWRLEDATTKEIQAVARTRFNKNAFANYLDQDVKIQAALDNKRFIEGMQSHPKWNEIAVEASDKSVPPVLKGIFRDRPWRTPDVPQFRKWLMDPRVADAIDDAGKHLKGGSLDDVESGLALIGHAMNTAMFVNPFFHLGNVLDHFIVAGGAVGNAKSLVSPSFYRAGAMAVRDVLTMGPGYRRMVDAGASLPYARFLTRDVHRAIVKNLAADIKAEPTTWMAIARAFGGYVNPIALMKGFYNAMQHILWGGADVMTLTREYEKMLSGRSVFHQLAGEGRLSAEEAIRETERHMPSYRVPGQVMGSRKLAAVFNNALFERFGRYHYGRLASYAHMVRAVLSNAPIADKAQALDQMAMLGLMAYFVYPQIAKALQWMVHEAQSAGHMQDIDADKVDVSRFGATAVPQAWIDAARGDKTINSALRSTFSPGFVDIPFEMASGIYAWNGQPILRDYDARNLTPQAFHDAASYVASKFGPAGPAMDIFEGRRELIQSLAAQFGVKLPTYEQVNGKQAAQARAAKSAQKRDAREEQRRAQ